MQHGTSITSLAQKGDDLFFQCQHCGVALVVASTAAGLTLNCQHCGRPTVVPGETPLAASGKSTSSGLSAQLAQLQRHLKENESQRTEIKGYINQLNIQLHRWQLRLQTLNERNQELISEIDRLGSSDSPAVPPG